MRLTGAELIVKLLERQGVTVVAGIPGGANLPLYDALGQSEIVRHVLTRHEQGAGFIAQGMARVTGEPAVCFATSGPGATNILTALADARLDSIPVVCITGQVPRPLIGTDAFQEVDIYGMSLPITKHNFLVRTAAELLEVIPEAFRIAGSGRPGPVLVDVPKDVQMQAIDVAQWPEPGKPDAAPQLDAAAVAAAAALINNAKRPVLLAGGGVVNSESSDLLVRLMEQAAIPGAVTLMGLGTIPNGHALSLGLIGMHGAPCANVALEECDLLLAVGMRFDDRATGRVEQFCPRARIVHIDIDAAEFDKIKRTDAAILGCARDVLETLLPFINKKHRVDWLRRVAELKERYPLQLPGADDVRSPYGLVVQTAALLDDDAVVVTDVGQHQMRVAQAYPFRKPRRWLTSGGLGTMGFGVPAAIGAALARPEGRVVCFTGDGSIMMNIQELATAVEVQANVKIVIMNNKSLGLVHQQQNLFYGQRLFACDYDTHVDFLQIARGFGVPAYDLDAGDARAILADAMAVEGPCLIHATVDMNEMVYPMVPPGAANINMLGVVLEDEQDAAADADDDAETSAPPLTVAALATPAPAAPAGVQAPARPVQSTVLEVTVKNHPGVMSHVCGLFARRAFNVEGILCMPVGSGELSRIWLLVNEDRRLGQMVKQVLKLEDVLDVQRHAAEHEVFVRLESYFRK